MKTSVITIALVLTLTLTPTLAFAQETGEETETIYQCDRDGYCCSQYGKCQDMDVSKLWCEEGAGDLKSCRADVEIEASGRPSCDDVPAGTNCDDINDEDSTVTYENEDDDDDDDGGSTTTYDEGGETGEEVTYDYGGETGEEE
jgi:hypothetical protein